MPMRNVDILSREDVKKIVEKEVEKRTFQLERLINLMYRRLVDLERIK